MQWEKPIGSIRKRENICPCRRASGKRGREIEEGEKKRVKDFLLSSHEPTATSSMRLIKRRIVGMNRREFLPKRRNTPLYKP